MNIEQLNGSGQHFWVFVITAVVTLALTGGSWWTIEQINSYGKWRKRRFEYEYDGKTSFTLAVRLALIAELASITQAYWFKSGAWWRVLVNHSSRLICLYDAPQNKGRLTTGEWLSKRPNNGDLTYYRPNDIQWRSAGVDDEES